MAHLPAHLGKLWKTQAQSDQCFTTFPHVQCFSAVLIMFLRLRLMKARWKSDPGVEETGFSNESKFTKHRSQYGFNT